MLLQQIIRAAVNPKIPINSLALNVSAVSLKINDGIAKILYRNTISAKSTRTSRMYALQPRKIFFVQYKRLKFIPYPVQIDLNPAMDYSEEQFYTRCRS